MAFNTSGAASGAAAGLSAFGPWGALIGGVAGGFLGGGDAPAPVYVPPPQAIGGVSNQYGQLYQDPATGASYQYGFQSPVSSTELSNDAVMSALMGQTPTGAGTQSDQDYQQARAAIQSQIQGLNQRLASDATHRGFNDVQGFNQTLDNLKGQLAQLDAAHQQAATAATNNPMLQFLSQGKYNNIADIINLNANNAALAQQQELASRGLSGSSIADLTNRQAALERGVQLGNTLQNVGQQDVNTRMAMLQALQGQNAGQQQRRLADAQMGLGYQQLGAGLGQNFADAMMQRNSTNTGLANAGNWAQFNQGQRNASDLGAAAGSVDWSKMFSGGGTANGSAPGVNMGGNLATNPAYNFGSSNPYYPNASFSTNMTAAGGR